MSFSSYIFIFLFLPVVCVAYFALPSKFRNCWLLISSLFFYSWNTPAYLLVLLFSIMVNYSVARMLSIFSGYRKKLCLITGIVLNISVLLCFKYLNFIIHNLNGVFLGLDDQWKDLVLPLGISFFTFQGISYIVDVYRGDVKALRNLPDVALYITLFPQLVAGPIVRFKTIVTQLHHRKSTVEKIGYGFRRFVYGLAKKLILADTFGAMVDEVFSSPTSWSVESTWLAIVAYTLQIYYDFSGYSDMAIGLGSIFGFHFEENFHYPYAALSITEFWRRWHISLSTWFRDYVYIPLGGGRVKPARHVLNILVVWLLTGIWHGANWTFLLWGMYYGLLLLGEKYVFKDLEKLPKLCRWLFTIMSVIIGWVFFRSANCSEAMTYLQTMFSFKHTHTGTIMLMRKLTNYAFFWIVGIAGVFPITEIVKKAIIKKGFDSTMCYAIIVNVSSALLFFFSLSFLISNNYIAFIYFQF